MKKLEILLLELEIHPKTGTGSPEKLRYYDGEVWSREVNKKDRLVYEIFEKDLLVIVIQSLGHYDDR
nr:type II toxin-antitoxin system YoeB family toxin [Kaistella antarctica]